MIKSSDAFRNIGEVADELGIPKHVLRFWEVKFPQIKPMKRGGGRRYYRPEDVELLRGIRVLLHEEGFTIRGVQKIFREQGSDQVKAASGESGVAAAAAPAAVVAAAPKTVAPQKKTGGRVRRQVRGAAAAADTESAPEVIDHVAKTVQHAIKELQACRSLLLG